MNKKKIIIKSFIYIFIIGIIYSIANIFIWYKDNKKNNIIKEELSNNIKLDNETNNNSEYKVDFKSLKEKNPDTVGYIKLNNTNIDYIVVKGNDNKFYLKHNFYKEYNRAGWIFMDYRNKLDGSDKNIIIYGHNTNAGSMFGTLRRVVKKEWYTNSINHIVKLYLDGEIKKYQVFSSYSIPVEDYYIETDFKDNEFKKFVEVLTNRSVYNYNVKVDENDNILTLSTCTGNGKKRMVLHAKEIINEI